MLRSGAKTEKIGHAEEKRVVQLRVSAVLADDRNAWKALTHDDSATDEVGQEHKIGSKSPDLHPATRAEHLHLVAKLRGEVFLLRG